MKRIRPDIGQENETPPSEIGGGWPMKLGLKRSLCHSRLFTSTEGKTKKATWLRSVATLKLEKRPGRPETDRIYWWIGRGQNASIQKKKKKKKKSKLRRVNSKNLFGSTQNDGKKEKKGASRNHAQSTERGPRRVRRASGD